MTKFAFLCLVLRSNAARCRYVKNAQIVGEIAKEKEAQLEARKRALVSTSLCMHGAVAAWHVS